MDKVWTPVSWFAATGQYRHQHHAPAFTVQPQILCEVLRSFHWCCPASNTLIILSSVLQSRSDLTYLPQHIPARLPPWRLLFRSPSTSSQLVPLGFDLSYRLSDAPDSFLHLEINPVYLRAYRFARHTFYQSAALIGPLRCLGSS
jgi:hypothetical protein